MNDSKELQDKIGEDLKENQKTNQSENIKTSNKKSHKALIIGIVIGVIALVAIVVGVIWAIRNFINTFMETNESNISNEQTITMNQTVAMSDNVEITILKNRATKEIIPPSASGYYTYFSADEGNIYIDVIANVKNLTASAVKQNSLFTAKLYIDNSEYNCSLIVEEDNGQDFNEYTNLYEIKPLETMTYHIAAQVPENTIEVGKMVKLIINANGKEYKYEISITDEENSNEDNENPSINLNEQPIEIKANETLKVENVCELKIVKANMKEEILPPSASGYYTYYPEENGKIYFDLIADIKNLKTSAIKQDSIVGNITLIYDENYEYDCFLVVEEDNGQDFNGYTNLYEINPLETMRYHIIAQIPDNIKEDNKSIDIKIIINGEEYIYHAR